MKHLPWQMAMSSRCSFFPTAHAFWTGSLAHDALGGSTTLSVGYGAHTNSAGTAVAAAPAAYKAAAASTGAQKVDILATLALGSGTETNVNENGLPVTVTMGGAAGTGTIELTIKYAVD
jgi:hypothetical protein